MPERRNGRHMIGMLSRLLTLACMAAPALAADYCDTAKAVETNNARLFARSMTRFSGIFADGDCKISGDNVYCERAFNKAGATELFGSTSGVVVAGVVNGSFEQCGYVQYSEDAGASDEVPGERYYTATYNIPADVADVFIDRAVQTSVHTTKGGGVRVFVMFNNSQA